MTDEIQRKIVEWMTNIEGLASSELPIFITQFCNYHLCENFIMMFVYACVLVFSWFFIKKYCDVFEKESEKSFHDQREGLFVVLGMCSVLLLIIDLVLICDFICLILKNIKIYICPKIFVIEYFMKR